MEDTYEADERAAIMEIDGKSTEESSALIKAEAPSNDIILSNQVLSNFRLNVQAATDADPILITFGGLGLLSSLLHKSYFYAPNPLHLNLFLFLLGQSSAPRKTTLINILITLLHEVAPELILPAETTPEALIVCLAERNHGTIFSRELNHFLDCVLGPDYNRGLSSTLGNIYDGGPGISRYTKKDGLIEIPDPVLTMVGAGVEEYLIPKIKKIDLVSGFWPRVTLVRLGNQRPGPWRAPGRFTPTPGMIERLKTIASIKGGEISFSTIESAVGAYSDNLRREAQALDNPNLVAGYLRLEWILVKIAAVLELADNPDSTQIGDTAFQDATILTDYIKQGLPIFYGDHQKESEEVKIAKQIEKIIDKKQVGDKFVLWRDILQSLSCKAGDAHAAANRLLEIGHHEQTDIPSTNVGGRPGKGYRRVS
jgi:hypothetical protein